MGSLLATAILLVPASLLAAEVGFSTLKGMVVYRGGEPANARIYAAHEGRYRSYTSKFKQDTNLGYTMENVRPGRYELVVTAPDAKPLRVFGVDLQPSMDREVNITLSKSEDPVDRLFFREQGRPSRQDVPRKWDGGWIEGTVLTEEGLPIDGVVRLLRGPAVIHNLYIGQPTIRPYFEERNVSPGQYALEIHPGETSGYKKVRIDKVSVKQNARTVLATIRIPKGAGEVILPTPESQANPIAGGGILDIR